MKRVVLLGVVASLATVLLLPAAASAKASKADVCHLNDVGGWQVNNVSERAVEAHLLHGDGLPGEAVPGMDRYSFDEDCVPTAVATGPAILAVAYSEVDQVAGFTAGDTLISAFEDVDGDGLPSIGDTIRTNRFPLNPAASEFGMFEKTVHRITAIIWYTYQPSLLAIQVDTASGLNQSFSWHNTISIEGYSEQYLSHLSDAAAFRDQLTQSGSDQVLTNGISPSVPSVSPLNVRAHAPGDQDFLNVEITPPATP